MNESSAPVRAMVRDPESTARVEAPLPSSESDTAGARLPGRASGTAICVCGHSKATHEHYRRGRDCSVCGATVCDRYRARHGSLATRLLSLLPGRRNA